MQASDDAMQKESPRSTLVVVVRVNTVCALACQHCGFSRELHRPRQTIDKELLLKLGASLQSHRLRSNQSVLVSWLGGEPFQWPDWREITQFFCEQLQLRVSVTTNGLALASPTVRRESLQWFDELTISIDGLEMHHDGLRQTPGMFRRLQEIVSALLSGRNERKPKLRVNTVLTRDSIASFPEFCFEMARWGIDELTFNALGGNDRPEFFAKQSLMTHQVLTFCDGFSSLKEQLSKRGCHLCGTEEYLSRMLASSRGIAIPLADCSPGKQFLFVDERCRISPCSFTSETLGIPIPTFPWEEDWSNTMQRCKIHLQPHACQNCLATHVFEKFQKSAGVVRCER